MSKLNSRTRSSWTYLHSSTCSNPCPFPLIQGVAICICSDPYFLESRINFQSLILSGPPQTMWLGSWPGKHSENWKINWLTATNLEWAKTRTNIYPAETIDHTCSPDPKSKYTGPEEASMDSPPNPYTCIVHSTSYQRDHQAAVRNWCSTVLHTQPH